MEKKYLYKLGQKLGLNKQDIESILKSSITSCTILLPKLFTEYTWKYQQGTLYGTISIDDF